MHNYLNPDITTKNEISLYDNGSITTPELSQIPKQSKRTGILNFGAWSKPSGEKGNNSIFGTKKSSFLSQTAKIEDGGSSADDDVEEPDISPFKKKRLIVLPEETEEEIKKPIDKINYFSKE